jgi:hypothetical protein
MDPIQIYEELKVAFGETQARVLTKHLSEIYEKVSQLASKEDFHKLQNVVYELAQAQRRTEQRVEELAEAQRRTEQRVEELAEAQRRTEQRVEELAEAQRRTEQRVEELAEAQRRTEQRVEELAEAQRRTEQMVYELAEAQKKTEARLDRLEQRVEELAEAQRRTEQRVEELTEGQKRLEETVQTGFKKVSEQISALGSRWGIKNEAMLRKTISSLAKEFGYSVSKGFYGNREVDIIIHNGIHILLEVTSSALKKDVKNLNLSAEDYQKKHNIEPRLVLAAVYISPTVMREITESPRRIEVFSGDEGDEEVFIL